MRHVALEKERFVHSVYRGKCLSLGRKVYYRSSDVRMSSRDEGGPAGLASALAR